MNKSKSRRGTTGALWRGISASRAHARVFLLSDRGDRRVCGGMETFIELLRQLPPDSGMAFVLIQHLDPTHASYLSEALGRATSLPVTEIQHGMRVEPDDVYVIPSNADVGIAHGALTL